MSIMNIISETHCECPARGSIKGQEKGAKVNLPGTGDTVIKQAVPPGGD